MGPALRSLRSTHVEVSALCARPTNLTFLPTPITRPLLTAQKLDSTQSTSEGQASHPGVVPAISSLPVERSPQPTCPN
jgi:hypothetical protein